jgi:hypothetical protein
LITEAARLRVEAPKAKDPGALNPDQPISPEAEGILREHLAANEEAIRLLHRAGQLPDSRYPIDLSLGAVMLVPHLAPIKGLVQLLREEAVYHSHRREPDQAVQSLLTAFAVAASLRNEPLLISGLVRIACVAITLQALERLLGEHQLSNEQLIALSREVAAAEADGRQGLYRALVGERAAGMSVFNMSFAEIEGLGGPAVSGPTDALKTIGFQLYRMSGMRDRDLSVYLELMDLFITSAQHEFPESLEGFRNAEAATSARFSQGLGRFAVISRMTIPALTKAGQKEAILASRLRSAQSALAIERFRLEHDGALPESLDQLAPKYLFKLPIDPFDGRPLVYERRSPKGYRIFTSAPAARSDLSKGADDPGTTVRR